MTSYSTNFAKLYDEIYSSKNYEFESSFISNLTQTGGKLLDIGCGTLSHSLLLHDKFNYILGIDESLEMLQEAKKKVSMRNIRNIALDNISISELPVVEEFDLVISLFNVINHIMTFSDLSDFCSQVYKRLRPGGQLVFDFWNGAYFRVEPPTRVLNRLVESSYGLIEIETITETDLMRGEVVMKSKYIVNSDLEGKIIFENSMLHRLWTPDLILELLMAAGFINVSITPAFESSRPASLSDRKIMVVCSK
jgi:SAM-dependent methyltransferase